MQIHYAGKITKDDFLKSLLLNNSQLQRQKWLFGTVLVLLALAIVFLQIQSPAQLAEIFANIGPSALIGLVFITFPWWTPYLQLMSYDQKGNIYRDNVYGTIDETEITINSADTKVRLQWDGYINYKIGKDLLLLCRGPNNFSIFTKNLFSNEDEWEKFAALTKDKIASNKKRA